MPLAAAVKVTAVPATPETAAGCVVTVGAIPVMVKLAPTKVTA